MCVLIIAAPVGMDEIQRMAAVCMKDSDEDGEDDADLENDADLLVIGREYFDTSLDIIFNNRRTEWDTCSI